MREIVIELNGGVSIMILNLTGDGGGSIESSRLKVDEDDEENDSYNAAIDGIESLVLAHAIGGVNVEAPEYIAGIQTAVDSCGENL